MTMKMVADILIFLGGMAVFTVAVAKIYQWVIDRELAKLESTISVDESEEDTQKVFNSEDLWEDEK